jgi:hypothetical protein
MAFRVIDNYGFHGEPLRLKLEAEILPSGAHPTQTQQSTPQPAAQDTNPPKSQKMHPLAPTYPAEGAGIKSSISSL